MIDFIKSKPGYLSRYVKFGQLVVNGTIFVCNKYMEHLLVIQGIDPTKSSFDKLKEDLTQSLDKIDDGKDYEGIDFSWITKSFRKTKRDLENSKGKLFDFNKDLYLKLTNLDNLPTEAETVQPAKAAKTSKAKKLTEKKVMKKPSRKSFKSPDKTSITTAQPGIRITRSSL